MTRHLRLALAFAVGIVTSGLVQAAEGPAQVPALIPREVLFGNPERAAPQLSPDGKRIAFLAAVDGVMNIWIAPADDVTKAHAVTSEKTRGIRRYFWSYTNDRVLYLQDDGGDENWRVYSVNVDTGAAKDLTPFDSIPGPDGKPLMLPSGKPMRPTAEIQRLSPKAPHEMLIGLNNRDPRYHDVYRINIDTGEMKLVVRNDEWAEFVSDDDLRIRFAMKLTSDGGSEYSRRKDDGTFEPFEKIPMEDAHTTAIAGFDRSGETMYFVESRQRNTSALYAVDAKSNERRLLAEDPRCDAGETITHPATGAIQGVSFNHLREEWKILDDSIRADLDYLKGVHAGEVDIISRSNDDSRWLVSYSTDNGPAYVYRYDRSPSGTPGKAAYLFTNRPALEKTSLASMHPVVIKSRDGLDLVSFLTLPSWLDTNNDARPDAGAIPLVLYVHGGPWARDYWGFNPAAQWLANRGYAVLQINFRSSTGLGKNFINAGNREWAAKMHDDLLDGVNWAVSEKIALKDKVAIMGGSYGGYATLVGLTFTPDVFACGVDIVGPSSILTLLNTIPPYWQPAIEDMKKRVGDHTTKQGQEFLTSRSPLSRVDAIKRPLLIGQGANDPRVKQSESDQIVAAMQKRSIPVAYVLFPDEGHGFQRPENRIAFFAVAEAFLSRHLGGRAEPFGDSVRRSTAQVPAGVDQIQGLSEALGGR